MTTKTPGKRAKSNQAAAETLKSLVEANKPRDKYDYVCDRLIAKARAYNGRQNATHKTREMYIELIQLMIPMREAIYNIRRAIPHPVSQVLIKNVYFRLHDSIKGFELEDTVTLARQITAYRLRFGLEWMPEYWAGSLIGTPDHILPLKTGEEIPQEQMKRLFEDEAFKDCAARSYIRGRVVNNENWSFVSIFVREIQERT